MKKIEREPTTEKELRQDLEALGVMHDMNLIVHSSLSSIGSVIGGAPTVLRALMHTIGKKGTLVMPAATPHCADPVTWRKPRVPEAYLGKVQAHLPVFDLRTTPTEMGAIPETFRTWPGTLRSNHPLESICAQGVEARKITSRHPWAFSEGRGGPFEKLYDLDSWVLLLGVGFNRCTALHFAESLVEKRRIKIVRFPVLENGHRKWIEVPNVSDDNDTLFPLIGSTFITQNMTRQGLVGNADSRLFSMRFLIDYAINRFKELL